MIPDRPHRVVCMGCGDWLLPEDRAEWDEREQAYYCGCPGSERMESTPPKSEEAAA